MLLRKRFEYSGIGPADICPLSSLQSKQLELERQRATDSLKKGLEKRPEKDELVERMFLRDCYVE